MTLHGLSQGPPLDLAVIGGGVNGAGVARAAARAGLRVALFEADDFGFGTTWRSTKLIHGGLRYLEQGDVGLVRESLAERGRLLRERPWLVRPLRFLLPNLPWSRRPAWQLRIGLSAYDLLAGRSGLPRHRRVDSTKATQLVGGLAPEVAGAFTFFDARARSPERLALELVLEAREAGATVFNHARVVAIAAEGGRVTGLTVRQGEKSVEVPARTIVNAAGPWVDEIAGLAPGTQPGLDLTRGTHIVADLPDHGLRAAVISTARSDGRVFFAIPQGRSVLIGTTDERYEGPAGAVRPTAEDISYLLQEAQTLLPGEGIERTRVVYAYAGLRPLARGRAGHESEVSRRHQVLAYETSGGPAGLLGVTGGKLTTYRTVAADVLQAMGTRARADAPPSFDASGWRSAVDALPGDRDVRARLSAYGPRLADVIALGSHPVCALCGLIEGEIRHAFRQEAAVHLPDVLGRRTGTAWTRERGLCCVETAATIAAEEAGWSHWEGMREVTAYRDMVAFHLPAPETILPQASPGYE